MTEENLNISPDPNSVIFIAAAMILVFIIPVTAVLWQKKRLVKIPFYRRSGIYSICTYP